MISIASVRPARNTIYSMNFSSVVIVIIIIQQVGKVQLLLFLSIKDIKYTTIALSSDNLPDNHDGYYYVGSMYSLISTLFMYRIE